MPYTNSKETKGFCDICGERFDLEDPRPSMNEVAEFFDPSREWNEETNSFLVHGQCGLDRGYQLA